ncbi:TPA: HAMP domain-containing histidine kinase [Burkholderia cepacia ATCC 25416]|nr:HAMP domain-containing histidine kinase [Burkholderia cepacia ATCC 25416]
MRRRYSLRFKVALGIAFLAVLLLVVQAAAIRLFAEKEEEQLVSSLIADDMIALARNYRTVPTTLPPFDPGFNGYVSSDDGEHVALPLWVARLPIGVHPITVGGKELHVAIRPFDERRLYRVYDFSEYERRFRRVVNALMVGTGAFALLTIWLAFRLSELLVRRIAGVAEQVETLHDGQEAVLPVGRHDEVEVVKLVETFNRYHQRMARMIEREKEFTANVSHELRTPLTTIKTSCALLLLDTTIGEKSRMRLEMIDRALGNIDGLVNALLMLAREESAGMRETISLNEAIDRALIPFSEAIKAKSLIVMQEMATHQRVDVNTPALHIVLSNLIRNAVAHTDRGSLRFTYRDMRLSIIDTGCGIAADELAHLFDRFYRASSTAKSDRSGLGLGLAIVKKICDQQGWQIALESLIGHGTTVTLSLTDEK